MRKLLLIGVLTLFVLAVGCGSQTVEDTEPPAPEPQPEQPAPEQPEEPKPQVPVEPEKIELFGMTSCDGNAITGTLTNMGTQTMDISKVKFIVNAALDRTPGCGVETLEPGQSTICSGIDIVPLGERPAAVVIFGDVESTIRVVCAVAE